MGLIHGRNKQAKRELANQTAKQFRYCIDKAIRSDVNWIFHTGDIFNRSKPEPWVIEQYYSAIEQALSVGINLAVIPGNHDKSILQPSLLDFQYKNYHVFNKLAYLDTDEFRLIASPYIDSEFRQFEQKIQNWINSASKPVIILLHQLFSGAWFGPQRFQFKNQKDCIRLDLSDHVQVLSGHIHRSQVLEDGKVIYTGSTVRTSFAEIIEPKGYLLGELGHKSILVKFAELPSMDMKVIELKANSLDIKQLDKMMNTISPMTRVLIRLTGKKIPYTQIQLLFTRYHANRWPYLSITPRRGTILKPLYSTYSTPFHFKSVFRNFSISRIENHRSII